MLKRFSDSEKHPLPGLLILTGIFLLCLVFSNILGMFVLLVMNDLGLNDLKNFNDAVIKAPHGWWSLMISQIISSFFSFVVTSYIYVKKVEVKPLRFLNFEKIPKVSIFILMFLAQMCFSPFNGLMQQMNENMKLPASMKTVEDIFRNMEDSMAGMMNFLAVFDTPLKFIMAFLTIAVLAGIGEELLFRGLIQRKLMLATKNPHVAIWLTAIVFSAIHFQFYGFLPRMLLGAVLGYFYYWSGNIWVPIAGHIFNNGLALVMVHLVKIKAVSPDIEKLDKIPLSYTVTSFIVFLGLMFLIQNRAAKETERPV